MSRHVAPIEVPAIRGGYDWRTPLVLDGLDHFGGFTAAKRVLPAVLQFLAANGH